MVFKTKFSKFLFLFFLLIFILHIIAIQISLYWKIRWIDIFFHFFGGLWLGFFAGWLLCLSGKVSIKSSLFFLFLLILSISALGGVFWEFSEFLYDQFISKKGYLNLNIAQLGIIDTMSDLFFDILGGAIAGIIFLKRKYHEKQT